MNRPGRQYLIMKGTWTSLDLPIAFLNYVAQSNHRVCDNSR